jgi:hypothetical protein
MQLRAGLVFDKRSEKLVGFLNGDGNHLPAEGDELASHVLVFYVVGINSSLSMSVAYFPTKGAPASMLAVNMWKAISWLETVCHLKVCE